MGVEGTYQCRVKTTEARKVKFGILIHLTMYVTTKNNFFLIFRDICKRTLDIEFERNWSVVLGSMLGNVHTEYKKIFFLLVSGIFREKPIMSNCWATNVL